MELPRPIPFALKPQQSRLIVPHQGKCKKAYGYLFGQSTRWIGRTVGRMPKRMPGRNPLLGERKQVREGVPLNSLATSPCLHPPINAHRASSCLIKANGENIENTSRPRCFILPRPVIGCWAFDVGCWMFPILSAIKPDRASSRLIKAKW